MTICKRIVSLFLCLILIATSITVIAGASEEVIETPPETVVLDNGVKLMLSEIYGETCYAVCNSKEPSGDVVIPDSYAGLYVRRINKGAFKENSDVTSVTMPDTVWVIMNGAFNSCPNLKWINISKNVIDVDNEAFLAMHGLEELRVGGKLNGEANKFSYNTNWPNGPQLGYMNYFVRDGVLFSNDSLYFIGTTHRYFDNVTIEYYPQGRKDSIYKIPSDVVTTNICSFFSPVYLETLVIPSSVRNFSGDTLYYYDGNSYDLKNGPVNIVFQHDSVPETIQTWYYSENGVKKSTNIPLYMETSFVRDAWDGSTVVFKDDMAKSAFESLQAEKSFVADYEDGDGGTELPSFVVAPKTTETLTLDTVVDEIDLDDTVTIFATQSPLDTTDDLEFSTADETIASFDGFSRGYLSGNKVGTTTYYVKSGDKVVQHDITVTCDHIDRNGNSTLSDWTTTKKATCTEDGKKVVTCTQEGCGQVVNTETIAKLDHKIENGDSAYEYYSEVDATCVVDGYKINKCSICGDEQKGDIITAPGHDASGSWIVDTEATCTEDGLKHLNCAVCKVTIKTEVLTLLGHNYAKDDNWTIDKDATCTEAGSKSHHCSRCDSKTDITEIKANGHNYVGKVTLAPGCTSEGVMTYTCSNDGCNNGYTEAISPKGHSFGDWYETLAPTCTEKGIEERTCSSCGAVETQNTKALGHDYATGDNWTIDVEPTCTKEGSKSHHCSRCDSKTDVTSIDALGHNYGDWVTTKEPTCTEEGSKHKTCSRCSDVVTEKIKANGHSFSEEFTIDKKATCIEDGQKSRHCANCDEVTEITVIKSEGHKEDVVVTEPTCTEQGYTTHTCTVCGNSYVDSYVNALGHKYGEWVENFAPTCTIAGQKTAYCDRCNEYIAESIEALGHKEESVVTAPTCTEDGFTTHTCTVCGNIRKDTYVDAKGHTTSEWIVDKLSTCTDTGSKHNECTVCKELLDTEVIDVIPHTYGEWETIKEATCTEAGKSERRCISCNIATETNAIKATGHSPVTDKAVAPTCTTTGLTEGSHCSVCNTVLVAQKTVPALGHSEGSWITDQRQTCTQDEIKHTECTVCGDIVSTKTTKAKGHTETNWLVDKKATCTATGSKHTECADCGATIKTATIDKLAHTSSDWLTDKSATVYSAGKKHKECTECGEVLETATIAQLKCSKPTLSSISNTTSGVKVSWSKVSGADRYRVYRKTSSSGWTCLNYKVTSTSYTDTSAKSGTKYYYTVRAENEAGLSSYNSTGLSIKRLATPKLSKAENTTSGVKITWGKVTGASGYIVYRKTSGGSWKEIGKTTKTYYTDKAAKSGTTYYYTVRAYSGSVKSYYNTTGLKIKHLADPTLNTPTSTRNGVSLKWNKVTGASGYIIYRKTGSGSYTKLATVKGSTKTSYVDKSAKKGKKYTYTVKAYYSNTYSAYSNTKTITDKY